MDFELNYTLDKLRKLTQPDRLKVIELLDIDSPIYQDLSDLDKNVFTHLVRAGKYIENINYRLDSEYNLPFLEYLNTNSKDEAHALTKTIFLGQKSINGVDREGKDINLAKGYKKLDGMGFYPSDLDTAEFAHIIETMLDLAMVEDLRSIFSVRTMVIRNGKYLKGIDYVDYFREDFTACADELRKASNYCLDMDFKEYLDKQIEALVVADPVLDAYADIKWASLGYSIYEFTITRERYDDHMTASILDMPSILDRLEALDIKVYSKDNLGCRVGIVNREGTDYIHKLSYSRDIASKYMPYQDEYKSKKGDSADKQTVVDADLIALFGDVGAYNGGITIAENLPNDDKLSLSMGGGNRNVYHRQIRLSTTDSRDHVLLREDFIEYYSKEASHAMTICHENTHSLGPTANKLGKYYFIIEELKADMGAYAFLREFVREGVFTEQESRSIIVTGMLECFLKGKPNMTQAHRVRSVMITNKMMETRAIYFDENFKLVVDFDLVIDTAKELLLDTVRLQLDGSVSQTKVYIDKYFQWTPTLEKVANIIKSTSKYLIGTLHEGLKDSLL